tara:strand:+ start:5025 stop:5696 length:672 start_codon:yes stop_codon:yes gene_type:complete
MLLILKKIKKKLKFFIHNYFYPYTALNNLDKKLNKYLDYNHGYFLEIGANDGISQSNTFFFEKKKKWKGILIESNKSKYLECKKNRSIKNKFYNATCVSKNYKKKYIKMYYADLMTSALKNKLPEKSYHKHFDKDKSYIYKVIPKTLDYILRKAKSPKVIDLFSLDVEGYEMEVLNGINFKMHNFKYILVETNQIKKIKSFLKSKNYNFIKKMSYHDYLFKFV